MVNLAEQMRERLQAMEAGKTQGAALTKAARDTDDKIQSVEYELLSRYLAASDDKYYESRWKVYYTLLWLDAEICGGAGDVAGGCDFGPTAIEPKLLSETEAKLDVAAADFRALIDGPVPAFNAMLQQKGLKPLDTKLEPLPDLREAYPHDALEPADD